MVKISTKSVRPKSKQQLLNRKLASKNNKKIPSTGKKGIRARQKSNTIFSFSKYFSKINKQRKQKQEEEREVIKKQSQAFAIKEHIRETVGEDQVSGFDTALNDATNQGKAIGYQRPQTEVDYSRSRLSSFEKDDCYDDFEHPPDLGICELHGVRIDHQNHLNFPPTSYFFTLKLTFFFQKKILIHEFNFCLSFPLERSFDCEPILNLLKLIFIRKQQE